MKLVDKVNSEPLDQREFSPCVFTPGHWFWWWKRGEFLKRCWFWGSCGRKGASSCTGEGSKPSRILLWIFLMQEFLATLTHLFRAYAIKTHCCCLLVSFILLSLQSFSHVKRSETGVFFNFKRQKKKKTKPQNTRFSKRWLIMMNLTCGRRPTVLYESSGSRITLFSR